MTATLPLDQLGNLALTVTDHANNPLTVAFDAPPVWGSSAPTVGTIAAAADGVTAILTPVALGGLTVSVSATIGGKSFSGTLDVIVGAGGPANLVVTMTAVPKP